MARPRDSQRIRTYRAAWGFAGVTPEDRMESIHDIRAWVEEIVTSQHWCLIQLRVKPVTGVVVKDGRGRKKGGARTLWDGRGEISFPRRTRHKTYILHELAHLVVPNDVQAHGREFIRVWISLTDAWLGLLKGAALRWYLVKHKAKWARVAGSHEPKPEVRRRRVFVGVQARKEGVT